MIDPELLLQGLSARRFSHGDGGRLNPMVFARSARNFAIGRFSCAHTRCGVSCEKKFLETTIDNAFRKSSRSARNAKIRGSIFEIIESYTPIA
jgi:hypothetical protein